MTTISKTGNLGGAISGSAPDDRIALVFCPTDGPETRLSYGDVRRTVARRAAALAAHVPAKAVVGLLARNSLDYMLDFLAIMQANCVACPINYKLPRETLEHVVRDSGVALLLHDDSCADILPSGVRTHPRTILDADTGASLFPITRPQPETACIMYTSGSTGLPKGVPITHEGYLWALEHYATIAESIERARTFVAAPMYHMNAQCTVLLALRYGGSCYLAPGFEVGHALDMVERHRITELTGVPTMIAMMMNAVDAGYETDLSSIDTISIGSAPLSEKLYARMQTLFPGAKIDNGYGTTETGFVGFGAHPDPDKPVPPTSIGYPPDAIDVRLDPIAGRGPDEGVLLMRTRMMTQGYLNRPEATAEKFVNGWYRTGDIMRRDGDGFYYFVEREDDMFVSGGNNIHPAEVEALLERHPGVAQAAVIPMPHDTKGVVPAAFIVPAEPAPDASALKSFALNEGPAYAHPRRIFFVDALPLASTKKIDRKALTAMLQDRLGG
ncbi:MAG: class I adenylate-forming enzyme family protein [Pseudomonadota bacterium]